jgi:hypothetical protein
MVLIPVLPFLSSWLLACRVLHAWASPNFFSLQARQPCSGEARRRIRPGKRSRLSQSDLDEPSRVVSGSIPSSEPIRSTQVKTRLPTTAGGPAASNHQSKLVSLFP